jgi:hypothetical protein
VVRRSTKIALTGGYCFDQVRDLKEALPCKMGCGTTWFCPRCSEAERQLFTFRNRLMIGKLPTVCSLVEQAARHGLKVHWKPDTVGMNKPSEAGKQPHAPLRKEGTLHYSSQRASIEQLHEQVRPHLSTQLVCWPTLIMLGVVWYKASLLPRLVCMSLLFGIDIPPQHV